MDVGEVALDTNGTSNVCGFGEVGALNNHFGSQFAAVGDLRHRCDLRHDDGDGNTETRSMVCKGKGVVSCARRDDAVCSLVLWELHDRVQRPSFLE